MRDFSTLDPTSLRAFRFAANIGHFTEAAKKAGLTQSGISQHVSKLETELGVKLFLRTGKSISLTPEGKRLVQFVEHYADQVDQLRNEFEHRIRQPKGLVSYAMPNSCLMTPHFQMLLDKRKSFSGVDLQVTIIDSDGVIQKLMDGAIDFGFVTKQRKHPVLNYAEFAREEYVLAADKSYKKILIHPKELKDQNFVKYPGMDVLFECWKSIQFPKSSISADELQYRGEINDLQGAITMVKNGVGLSVFPKHCIQNELNSGEMISFPGNLEKCREAFPIWIVSRNDVTQSVRVRKVIDAFWEMVHK
jgi:DNA-binding transcriptional LysR family regulator